MKLSETLLAEFNQEAKNTRRVLERVPEDRLSWQPHPKSMSLGRLASHLAELPFMGASILLGSSFDVDPPDGNTAYVPQNVKSKEEILALFDKSVTTARRAIADADDDLFRQPWSLLKGGQPVWTLPKAAVLRNMLLNHTIHHRGQLTVYLRLVGAPVPAVYGPSADEEM
jgi:uncharacterized damage-inducible protein DinB